MAHDLNTVRAALTASRARLQPQAHVVATGVGYKTTRGARSDTLSIVCSVTEKIPLSSLAPRDRVPAAIDGISTGHRAITAGTLGCLVRKGGQLFILSNNHVLANSNDARRGDAILQPGPHDGGRFPEDHIADLEDFVPIAFPEPPSEW